jgi:Calx-beta domain
MRRGLIAPAAAALALIGAAPARAAFTPVQSAGPDAAAIDGAVTSFRTLLGADGGAAPGSQPAGRREVDWDDAPASLPGDYYNATSPRGAVLSTPGSGLGTSSTFGMPTYSPSRLFAPSGSTITDVAFRVPGTDTPATVAGFAAVFSGVDGPGTRIDYFDAAGALLGTAPAAAGALSFAGASGVDIARVRITSGTAPTGSPGGDVVAVDDLIYGEPRTPLADFHVGQSAYATHETDGAVAIAVRRSGGLGPGSVRVTTAPGSADAGEDYGILDQVVAFAAGEQQRTVSVPLVPDTGTEGDETFTVALDRPVGGVVGTPGTATVTIHDDPPGKKTKRRDRSRPRVTLSKVRTTMPRSRFAKGIRFRVKTNEAASLDARLLAHAGQARISRAYNLTLAHRRSAAARGTRALRLRPARSLLGTAARFTVRLRVLAVDVAGNRRTVSRTIRVRPARR